MSSRVDVLLTRPNGSVVETNYLKKDEVLQIPQRDGTKICVFPIHFVTRMSKQPTTYTAEVRWFAADGKTQLPLKKDAAGHKLLSAGVMKGRTLEFHIKPGVEAPLLIQAGPGDPPKPRAMLFDSLPPAKRGDRIVIHAK